MTFFSFHSCLQATVEITAFVGKNRSTIEAAQIIVCSFRFRFVPSSISSVTATKITSTQPFLPRIFKFFSLSPCKMLDPFAEALGSDVHTDFDSVARRTMRNNEEMVIDCDEPDLDAIEEAAMQGVESSAEKQTAAETQVAVRPCKVLAVRKRLAAQKKQPRRAMDPTLQLKLKAVPDANASEIRCLLLTGKKGGQEAIPLWPQFIVEWRNADFGDRTWLSISTQSRWLHLMVNAISPKCARELCQYVIVAARSEFAACMTRARSPLKTHNKDEIEHQGSDSDSDADMPAALGTSAALNIEIGGYTVKCINTKRQMLIVNDEASLQFIRHWLLPLAHKSIDSAIAKKLSLPEEKLPKEISGGFHFSANPMPNISNKVTWNPEQHAWRMKAKKPRMKMENFYVVDWNLPSAAYHKIKSQQYQKAVDAWNQCDGSTRHRIKVNSVLLDSHGETSEAKLE